MARAQPVGDTEPANPVDVLCAVGQHCAAESGEGLANSQPAPCQQPTVALLLLHLFCLLHAFVAQIITPHAAILTELNLAGFLTFVSEVMSKSSRLTQRVKSIQRQQLRAMSSGVS